MRAPCAAPPPALFSARSLRLGRTRALDASRFCRRSNYTANGRSANHEHVETGAEVLAVLGAPNDADGHLSVIASSRCDRVAVEYRLRRRPILPTGGFGEHFNLTDTPHYDYVRRRLVELGVRPSDILAGLASRDTAEDVRMISAYARKAELSMLVVVTSDFHVERVRLLFGREAPDLDVTIVAAATDLPANELRALGVHEARAIRALLAKRPGDESHDPPDTPIVGV